MGAYPAVIEIPDANHCLEEGDLLERLGIVRGYRASVFGYFAVHELGCRSERGQGATAASL
ncbi:hypothetical protein FHY09_002776 [Xanthomonas sp. 60]